VSLFCPSAQPDMADAQVLGVLSGSTAETRIAYLDEPLPVSDEILALLPPQLEAAEVLRFSARCEEASCAHFDGTNCQLATRIVDALSPVVSLLPRCTIRRHCRWYQQEGQAACRRCPQIVTHLVAPSPVEDAVAATPMADTNSPPGPAGH